MYLPLSCFYYLYQVTVKKKKEIQNFKRNELKINAPFLVAGALEID